MNHETKGPYNTYFYLYFALYIYGYGYGQTAGPGQSKVIIKTTLKGKNGSVIEKQFEKETQTDMLRNKNNVHELRQNYVNGMVESLSMAFKDCIEKNETPRFSSGRTFANAGKYKIFVKPFAREFCNYATCPA